MVESRQTGWQGEELAARWLLDEGFSLLHRNWRCGRYELDLVASKQGVLHLVEVKTRHKDSLTSPEQALDRRKTQALVRAARAYLEPHPFCGEVQFDLIAIEIGSDTPPELRYIEDTVELHW